MPAQEPEELLEFIRLFNQGKYFESHEILEELWRKTSGKKKRFYQGLIQAAVALHHAKNQNAPGAQHEYHLSIEKLKDFPENFSGFQLKRFRKNLACFFSANAIGKIFPKIDRNSKNCYSNFNREKRSNQTEKHKIE